jgi:low temperature requirement protein LtrA
MTTRRAAVPLRRPEAPQRATYLELLFDLAFVFALYQLSHVLLQHLRWSGAIQTMVLLLAVWAVWNITTWITDRLDPQRPAVELLVIVILLGSLVLAAALPQAFGRYGLIFSGVYVAIRLCLFLFLVLAMRGHELQRVALRALLWSGGYALLWIAGALTHETARGALWVLAIAVENAAFTLGFPTPRGGRVREWEPPVAAEHFAERYRQIFIIALGELIVVSGLALSAGGFAPARTAAFVVSIATTALLWRIYIYRAGEVLPAAFAAVPVSARLGRWAAYVQLIMVAGIVVTAVGNELVITHPSGQTAPAWTIVILGGPALFLAGRSGFEYAVFARVSRDLPIGVLMLAALTPVTLLVPPILAATAAMAVLAGVAIADAARARRHPAEQPSPGARRPP